MGCGCAAAFLRGSRTRSRKSLWKRHKQASLYFQKSKLWRGGCSGGVFDTEGVITVHTGAPRGSPTFGVEAAEELTPSTAAGHFCEERPSLCGLAFLCLSNAPPPRALLDYMYLQQLNNIYISVPPRRTGPPDCSAYPSCKHSVFADNAANNGANVTAWSHVNERMLRTPDTSDLLQRLRELQSEMIQNVTFFSSNQIKEVKSVREKIDVSPSRCSNKPKHTLTL